MDNLSKLYYNSKDLYMSPKVMWGSLNKNKINPEIIKDFPVNKPIKFDKTLMIKAIQFGMILMINYRGDKDKWRGGRERVICPLVFGANRNTQNMLVRGWHLDGWSVSLKNNTKNFFARYWWEIILGILVLFLIGFFVYLKMRIKIIRKKIKGLKVEEVIIHNLIKKAQEERFNEQKISSVIYDIRMKKYQERTDEIKEILPVLEKRLKDYQRKK